MLNEIVHGIAMTLNAAFGAGYEIYQNNVEQGLREPCFFIALVENQQSREPSGITQHTVQFDVHYFPKDASLNAEMESVGEELMDCMDVIKLEDGSLLRGVNRRYNIVDGVLHFFVAFSMRTIKNIDGEPAESITISESVRG